MAQIGASRLRKKNRICPMVPFFALQYQAWSALTKHIFILKMPINKQNNRIWGELQPGVEKPLQDQKILVWLAISANKVYGVYYFESCVDQHNYLNMLKTFFWPKHLRTVDYQKYYFQQDGAAPHTANLVQTFV